MGICWLVVALSFLCVAVQAGWELAWSDEFNDQKKLNTSNWNPFYSFEASLNGEMEYYAMDAFTFTDSTMGLVQARQSIVTDIGNFSYTSGLITSKFKYSQTYGYFEMRAQVPINVQGTWPAFWLLPEEQLDDDHPAEIDIMEMISQEATSVHTTYHCNYTSDGGTAFQYTNDSFSADDFHIFAAQWLPKLILFYVDNVNVFNVTGDCIPNRPEYILANVALGGWASQPDPSTPFPCAMNIDYIRAYTYVNNGGETLPGPGEGIDFTPQYDPPPPFDLANPRAVPETADRGDTITVYVDVIAPVYTSDLNVQFFMRNLTGAVSQVQISNVDLQANQPTTISASFEIPAEQPDGYLKIGLGIFDSNWNLQVWISNVWAAGVNVIVGASTSD